jgi:hypothetical protein
MKKLTLLEQLDRIQQMMGVPQKLIIEAAPPPVNPIIEKGAKQLWKTIEELFSGTIEKGTEESLEKVLEELESVVGKENVEALKLISKGAEDVATKNVKITNFLANNPIIKKNIEQMLEADKTFSKAFYESMDKFIKDPEVSNYLSDFYNTALERTGGDVEKSKELLISVLGDDFTEEELKRYFNMVEVKKLPNGEFKIEFKEKNPIENIADTPINLENATENSAGHGPGINSEEVIDNIENLAKKPGTINQIIQSLVRSFNLQDLQSVLSGWRRAFKKMDKLQAEFNVYAQRMEQNIKSGLRYDAEFKKMQDILLAVKKTWSDLPKETYNTWLSELPPRVKNVINGVGDTGRDWKIFYNELLKQKEWVEPLLNETAAFKKLWPFRMPGSESKGWFFLKAPSKDLSKRLGNLILFKDPRTFAEMKESLMVNGVQQDIARTIVSKVAAETILGPMMLASLGQLVRPISSGGEALFNVITDSDANWIDYNEPNENGERSSNPVEIVKNDWLQVVKSLMPANVWEALWDVVDITFIDEFFNNILTPFITVQKSIEESGLRKKAKEFTDRKSAEYQQWYNQQSEASKKVIDEYVKKINNGTTETVNKIDPLFLAFQAYIKQNWGSAYTGRETFAKEDQYYVVNDGTAPFYYTYNGKTFEEVPPANK